MTDELQTMTTILDRLLSSRVSRTYRGDRQAFGRIQAYLEDTALYTEVAWERVSHDDGEAVVRKGTEVTFTFDDRSRTLEVLAALTERGFEDDRSRGYVCRRVRWAAHQRFPGRAAWTAFAVGSAVSLVVVLGRALGSTRAVTFFEGRWAQIEQLSTFVWREGDVDLAARMS